MFADVQVHRIKEEEKEQRLVEPLVINIINSGLSAVQHVCCLDSETIWTSGNGSRLRLLNNRGKERRSIKSLDQHGIGGMSISKKGELMFCSPSDKAIYKVIGKDIEQFCSTGDFVPRGMHWCRNGDILVSVCKGQKAKVDRYGGDGYKKQEIEIKQNGRRLFRKPSYLTQNISGDICVSDQNKVVVTTNDGRFRFNYYGGRFKAFGPQGICCNKLAHIIVADDINNIIHVVNDSGALQRVLDTSGQGILGQLSSPSSLSIDDNGYIWVGEVFSGFIKVLKYLELCYV